MPYRKDNLPMTDQTPTRAFVPYLRVSTDRQGRSGLGLEAQQAAIAAFLRPGDVRLCPDFVEIESGRNAARPKLAEALEKCRRTGATLLIAKLDRLARSVHFVSGLLEAKVPFVAADMPTATPFMIQIYAAVAEEEARAIGHRTKVALAAAKARGVKLGGARPGHRPPDAAMVAQGTAAAATARKAAADHFAHRVVSRIEDLKAAGMSLARIAAKLGEEGIPTARGGAWTATAVLRVLRRTSE